MIRFLYWLGLQCFSIADAFDFSGLRRRIKQEQEWEKRPIIVFVFVNKVKLRFLLDTGATFSSIHADIAEKLHLQPMGLARTIHIAGGQTMKSDIAIAPLFEVGYHNFYNRITRIDPERNNKKFDGTLGLDIMNEFIITIDYQKGIVTLKHKD